MKVLTDLLQQLENWCVFTRLPCMCSNIIKNTFGTADVKAFAKAGQASKAAFKAAMDTTFEDHLLSDQQKFIDLIWECIFPDEPGQVG